MDNEQWQRVETIFEQALEQAPETRGDFLRTACAGDAALLHDVEQLLRHHGAAESRGFLENTAGLTATLGPKPAPEDTYIGKDLGPYRIQKRLGQGGMGNVYLAVRHAEYRQQVAIKVLRRGMDTENILQRFRNEIQVLAAVSKHENIAGLLDGDPTPWRLL